jgi:hypothetical protein
MLRVRNSIFRWYSTYCIPFDHQYAPGVVLTLNRNKKLHREKLAKHPAWQTEGALERAFGTFTKPFDLQI